MAKNKMQDAYHLKKSCCSGIVAGGRRHAAAA